MLTLSFVVLTLVGLSRSSSRMIASELVAVIATRADDRQLLVEFGRSAKTPVEAPHSETSRQASTKRTMPNQPAQRFCSLLEAKASFLTSPSGMGWLGEKVTPVLVDLSPAAAMSSACALMAEGDR